MKTSTLHRLVEDLTDVRHHHLAYARIDSDPVRQSRERDQAHRAGAVLDAIRFELFAREARDGRSPDAARRADRYLERLLADFLELGDLDETLRTARPARLSTDPESRAEILIPAISDPSTKGDLEYADSIRQHRQAGDRIG